MCEFCKDKNSDDNDNMDIAITEEIIKTEEGNVVMSVATYISAHDNHNELYSRFVFGSHNVIGASRKINYCPMCGKKFESED